RNDMGAICPGRWHVWQFFWRIGRTSLLKVGSGDVSAAIAAPPSIKMATRRSIIMGGNLRLPAFYPEEGFCAKSGCDGRRALTFVDKPQNNDLRRLTLGKFL